MEKKEIKFQDQDFEENFHVGQSKAKVKTKEQQNQTDKIQLRHIRLQVKGHHDIETQTQEEKMKTPRVSDEDVLEFLQRVTPMVQKALAQNLQSRTFKNLNVAQNVLETAKQISVIQQCQIPVSAVAWNCTGSIICMAFSEEEHEGWCTHVSQIQFANLLSAKKPLSQETECCTSCLKFHPSKPNILALGNFNGQISL